MKRTVLIKLDDKTEDMLRDYVARLGIERASYAISRLVGIGLRRSQHQRTYWTSAKGRRARRRGRR